MVYGERPDIQTRAQEGWLPGMGDRDCAGECQSRQQVLDAVEAALGVSL